MNVTQNVVLIHGLYTSPVIMRVLGKRLSEQGFVPHYFAYATTKQNLHQHALALANWLREKQLVPCHFVAHSLGGLLLQHLADVAPELFQARVVTLGSPHRGSLTAKWVHGFQAALLGGAWQDALDGSLPEKPLPVLCGNIAGCAENGVGKLVLKLPQPNDGTVALEETRLPESVPLLVHCGHTDLLFNKDVAQQTGYFLQNGCFQAA